MPKKKVHPMPSDFPFLGSKVSTVENVGLCDPPYMQQQERPVRGHKRKRSIVQDSFDRLRQQRGSFGLAGSPTVMMGTTPSVSMSTANTSHYPNSSSINQNLKNNLTRMTTATLPTIKKQQQQQQLQSRVNFNNNNTSNNNKVTIATGDTSTSTSICNSRKRSMDTATQTEDGSPPTKARIVGSPLAAESYDIVHDRQACMFKMKIDGRGTIAALCYLPTRVQTLIEFYHTEIPIGYRDMGLGDLLVKRAFEWAEERKALIIATCPFVRRYLARHPYNNVVRTEQEAIERLIK
ncbi:hypothetical protein INT45_000995 [Circinella minor]|uniref:N-acetyltransferase domain-containing protein n=1 Tax=Circinella minor TaxID=1195481 RepID=A0A8H7SEL8_9FUNG|nr:hypothetical protein INT45_000995 [Circinella minor]